ncbi:sugar phosphate isomerase/epimerase family protein [Pseudoduganella namucuonensis]|uniref:Sugar phosphate isomerase/epimerase n=1 Tax=Pseudoduganella namucuonensis TaxID=1035707 RepID=A0A1I7LZA4_9BURK|nr:TIM barrel protein [Pseudoduganella namucuonensis]SFV15034.1 Sugar phosphate isomerase/epimerase [Pseudoduganella namucuonensis]
MYFSRRDMMRMLAGAALAAALPARAAEAGAGEVPLGVQTYSLRELLNTPGDMVDKMIAAMTALGVKQCELFEPTIQPPELSVHAPWASAGPGKASQASLYGAMPVGQRKAPELIAAREAVRQWRLSTPDAYFADVGRRFARAGIEILAFNFLLKDDCTDAEVERGFAIAKLLGTRIITASTTLTMAKRTVPFAERHNIVVAMHNHSNLSDPNQFATPESFEQALAMSPLYWVNLDLGHYCASGFDPLPFIRKHHKRISNLHVKDRQKNDGRNQPFGRGDTPIKAVLQLNKTQGYRIPCTIEYEYAGTEDAVRELAKCLAYVKDALA